MTRAFALEFWTARGTLYAVNGVSFSIARGETLGIVGESGSGKSVTSLALLGLLPRAGRVPAGSARFEGRELLGLPDKALRRIRGRGDRNDLPGPDDEPEPGAHDRAAVREALETHFDMERDEAEKRAAELLDQVGIPTRGRRC